MTNPNDNIFKKTRLSKGLSQAELAIASKIDERTIRKLEQDIPVSIRTRREVARVLDLEVDLTRADATVPPSPIDDNPDLVEKKADVAGRSVDHEARRSERLRNTRTNIYSGLLIVGLIAMTTWVNLPVVSAFQNRIDVEIEYAGDGDLSGLATKADDADAPYEAKQNITRSKTDHEGTRQIARFSLTPSSRPCRTEYCPKERDEVFASFSTRALRMPGVLNIVQVR